MKPFFLTLLLLAGHGSLAAASLPSKAERALEAVWHRRGLEETRPLQAAAESAYKQGASVAELKAFFEQAPTQASAEELEKGLNDMAGLINEGLEDREARRAALKALQARLKAKAPGATAKTPGSSDDRLREAEAQRREETRRRLGMRGAEANPGPTPVIH
jgi:hypothetical protein